MDEDVEWRFKALENRVTYVNELPIKVERLSGDLKSTQQSVARLERELTHEDGAVAKLTRKLEEMARGPARRREGLFLAIVGAFIGVGGGGLVVALLTGHP